MRPLPYSNTAAGIVFYTVVVIFLLVELRVRVRSRLNQHGSPSDQGSFLALYVLIVAGVAGGFALAEWHPGQLSAGRWPIFVAGIVVMVVGIALRQWSVVLLGQFFTVDVRIHPGQRVVESGPYRWVRHPAYTGLLLTFVGIGLALGSWASVAVLVVLPSVGLVIRIRVEERALLRGLGEPYRCFAATRSRLIPRVW